MLDTSSLTTAASAWKGCSSLTSFPKLNFSSCTNLQGSWNGCTSLENFRANVFDDCPCVNFTDAFKDTNLSQASIDNILVSIDHAGQLNGTFTQSGGSAPSAVGEAAIDRLSAKGWSVEVTGGYLGVFNGASAVYSLRKATAYGGNVVRLRRASDNAESDFTAADLVGSVEGAELVTNGGFDTDSDWVKGTGWSITGGEAVCDGTQVSSSQLAQASVGDDLIASGLTYGKLVFTVSACSDFTNAGFRIATNSIFYKLSNLGITTPGTYTLMFAIGATANRFNFFAEAGVTMTLDNVSCKTYTPSAAEVWAYAGAFGYGSQTADSAYVTTWYDQSGSGNDATQSTAAAQPLLVRAGVTNTENGKPALSFDGTDDVFGVTTDISSVLSAHSVFATSNLTYDASAYFVRKTSGTNPQAIISGMHKLYNDGSSWRGGGGELAVGYQNLATWLLPGSNTNSGYSNGVEIESGVAGNQIVLDGSDANIGIGGHSAGTNLITGNLQELIIYDSDQSDNRYDIESSINDYYNIYYDSTTPIVGGIQAPVASAAYSLRSLDGDATANVVRLRRASDNEERDFTAADLVGGVEGEELITNGGFDTNTDWYLPGNRWDISSGQAVCDGTNTTTAFMSQNYAFWNPDSPSDGDLFILSFDIVSCSDFTKSGMQLSNIHRFWSHYGIGSPGSYKAIIRWVDGITPYIFSFVSYAGVSTTLDNVSLKPYTATAAEEWMIGSSPWLLSQDNAAYVTTWYDQAASNEQVFDDPTITGSWADNGDVVTTSGVIEFTNVSVSSRTDSDGADIPAGTYRIEVDYEDVTQASRLAVGVVNETPLVISSTGSGTQSVVATFDVTRKVSVRAANAISGQSGKITGIRFIDIGNPATQSASTAQPKLITAGVTEKENGKPAMVFDGTDDYLINEALQATQATTFFSVAELVASMRLVTGTDGINRQLTYVSGNVIALYAGGFVNTGSSVSADFGNQTVITSVFNGASSAIYRDGASYDTGDAGAGNLDGLIIGANYTFTGFNPGRVQEIILYDSDQSTNRFTLEANINNYFNIF